MHEVVKEVTQPVHGPDGFSVLFAPGDQFPQDHDLPAEVPWRLVVAEVPDKPVPKAAGPAKASGKS